MPARKVADGEILTGAGKAGVAERAYHDEENPFRGRRPSAASSPVRWPLRELIDGRVLDELLRNHLAHRDTGALSAPLLAGLPAST